MKKFSVIIVSYGQPELVRNCLRSIYETNDINDGLEVIISDNSPTLDIVKMVNREFPDVITVKNDNVGFGRGNNLGYAAASGEYVLFLNPDTIIEEPVFQTAINIFEADAKLGMFGVKLLNEARKKTVSFSLRQEYQKRSIFFTNALIKLCNFFNRFNKKKMYPYGAALFIRSSVFETIGKFDENIFMYYEEPDLCNRIGAAGYYVDYVSKIKIVHLAGKSTVYPLKQLEIRLNALNYYAEKYKFDCSYLIKQEFKLLKFKNKIHTISNFSELEKLYEHYIKGSHYINDKT